MLVQQFDILNTFMASSDLYLSFPLDSRGISRPVQLIPEEGPSDAKRRKKIKPDTHRAGDRMRYFADDDRQSLKEMVQKSN